MKDRTVTHSINPGAIVLSTTFTDAEICIKTGATVEFRHCRFNNCYIRHELGNLGSTVLFAKCSFSNSHFDRDILDMVAVHACDGVLYMGVRDGYVVLATAQQQGGYIIHAGCRKFRLAEARAHWARKRYRAEIRRAVEDIAVEAAHRVRKGDTAWRAR